MRLPWFSQRHSQRSATRRKRAAPLKVRRLERRRVLDAAVTDLVFAPADLDPSTAAHDSGEGTPITVSANATGTGTLVYDWTLSQNGNTIAQGNDPTFNFTPLDEANYSLTLTVTDQGGEGTAASRTEDVVIHNVRPALILAENQQVEEGETLNLIAPQLGLFVDPGILDTHEATIDWGDGSAIELADKSLNPPATTLGGTHTYTEEGKYKVTVSVTDFDGGVDTKSFFVTVTNAAPTATLSNDGPVKEGSAATVTFTNQFDPNPADAAAGFRYAYDFNNDDIFEVGDGTYAGSVTDASQVIPASFFAEGPGTHTVRARIIDKDGGSTDYLTEITIDNVAPQLVNVAAVDNTIDEGQSATINMTIDDPSLSDVFSVEVDWKDGPTTDTIAGLGLVDASGTVGSTSYQWDAETRQLTVTHLYKDDNPTATTSDKYTVALTVRDDDLGTGDSRFVDIIVNNVRPTINAADNQTVNEGAVLNLSGIGGTALAVYVDLGVEDTYTATVDWGDGSAIESPTIFAAPGFGTLGGTHTYAENGTYTVTVTLTDDDGLSHTDTFQVSVLNVAPTIDTLAITSPINEGQSATLTGTYSDDGSLDTHELDIDWDGNGTFDQTVTVSGGSFSISHPYPDDNPTGTPSDTFNVNVRLRDDDGDADTGAVALTVNNVRPSINAADNQTVNEGAVLNLSGVGGTALAVYVDLGVEDTFTATVDWGDGSAIEAPAIFAAPGFGTLGATHTYAENGTYTVTVTLTDDDGLFHSDTFLVTVLNVAPTIDTLAITSPINEGQSATLTGTYSDPGVLDTHQLDIDWDGDGTFDQTVVVSGGSFSVSHPYPDDNPTGTPSDTFTVNVRLRDDDGDADTGAVALTVNNVRPSINAADNQTVNEGAVLNLSGIGGTALAVYVDLGIEDTFTATVDWGDGSAIEAPTIFAAPGFGTLGATHTYADNGTYTVTVTLTDDDGLFHTDTFQVTVLNVVPTLDVDPTATTVDEGAEVGFDAMFSDPGFDNPDRPGGPSSESFRYFVDWGDGRDQVPNSPVADTDGGEMVPSTGMFSGTHTYADNGIYTVTVRVADDDMSGNFATGVAGVDFVERTFTITVNNVLPTLEPTGPKTVDEGSLLSITNLGTITDPGFRNTTLGTDETFTYSINWGDGTNPDTGAATLDDIGGVMDLTDASFDGSHTYADDGIYTVIVRVADDDMSGNFATGVAGVDFVERTFTVTVNNVRPTLVVAENQTVAEGTPLNMSGIGGPSLGLFVDPGVLDTHTAIVDWGDGSPTESPTMFSVPGAGTLGATHTYADDGVYTVTVRVADDDMSGDFVNGVNGIDFVEKTFTVTVNNVAPSLTGTDGRVVNEGDLVTLGGLGVGLTDPGFDNPNNPTMPLLGNQFTEEFAAYTIDWGDGSAPDMLMIDVRNSDVVDGPTTATFKHLNETLARMDHVYADNGVYTVTIRVADDNMAAFSNPALFADDSGEGTNFVDLTFTITVNNVKPTLTLPNGDLPAENQPLIFESQTISLTDLGVITDPGFSSSLPGPNNTVETFRYWIDWNDDGTFDTADTADATIDDNGGVLDLTDASFDGSHTYADNGTYTVRVRVADDDMGAFGNVALFENGVAGTDYVEMTFTIVVNNVAPAFTPQPNGENLAAPDLDRNGITTVFVAYNDPGYDNPNNPLSAVPDNGGERVETFNHVIQWGDGTVDAVHQYTTVGTFTVTITVTGPNAPSTPFVFQNISSLNPVVNLVGSQQLNDPSVVPQLYSFQVAWGDGHVETFTLSLLNPGIPAGTNGLTTLVTSARTSGNATTNTTGLAAIQHRYLGPPNPLNPTADITITLSVYDDDGGFVTDTINVGNPGISTPNPVIDTTPDVPRLDLTTQPLTVGFVADQGGLAQLFQVPDVRGGGGDSAATTERYLELRIVYPDNTESEGFKIKDEALADLRAFFKTLPDGRYRIYMIRTENHSERLVIQVDVRRGRVIDVADDAEGTRDRPPTEEGAPAAVPLDQNPLLEQRQGGKETEKQGEFAENAETEGDRVSLSPPLPLSLSLAALAAAEPWSRRVDDALAGADEGAWQRLRRAGRRGRWAGVPKLATRRRMRNAVPLDYNSRT